MNLRTGPSESNQIITLIPKKTKLNVISVIDNYQDLLNGFGVYVDYNGQKGYVNSGYLSFETQLDMDNLSSEQIFVIGMILYHRYLSDTHVLSLPSVLKLNYDIEVLVDDTYENNNTWYRKILPQGLHISDIESAYIEEFSKKYHTPSYSQYFIEHDGYVWEPFGFGGDVEFDYSELVKLYKITETEIEYIIKEHRRNAYGTQMEVEVEFTIVKEDGIWKSGKITKHA
ncbi:MAG: SH3 domain-containing protein [Ruminococcus sp.]|nr:SH3 domain-containing protein [Ruminococcus sp.]